MSTCADGFEVTFVGATMSNTLFTYTICNVDTTECNAPMALSHADILIANPSCIPFPDVNITTTIIGTDGSTERACNPPTDNDKSCGKDIDNLSELLIKCDMTDGIFEPTNPGQCITIEIEILNSNPPITVGPSISLNKAGSDCGSGCLLGPSCVACGDPPLNPCRVITEKTLIGSVGPATFGYTADFDPTGPVDFTFPLTAPGPSSSFGFDLPVGEGVTVTEDVFPQGWTFNNVNCVESPMDIIDCTTSGASFDCTCMANDGTPVPTATCTFSNDPPTDPPCDIEIVKLTIPANDPEDFDFTSNIAPNNFLLVDGGTQMFMDVDVGAQLAVEEALPTNWVLDSIICQGGNQSQFDIDEANQIVRITCDSANVGTTRTCTFNNRFDPPPPGTGCCIVSQGMCFPDTPSDDCDVPPNVAFLEGEGCNDPRCETPPPGEGCCVEDEGVCSITTADACMVPPNLEYLGIGSNCTDEPLCQVLPIVHIPIPTISEWGLIVMAGLLGIIGFIMALRNRKITA